MNQNMTLVDPNIVIYLSLSSFYVHLTFLYFSLILMPTIRMIVKIERRD
jgi:hypothetical protein